MLLGVDVGGTFTDAVLLAEDGSVHTAKVPSTPGKESDAVMTAIARVLERAGAKPHEVERFAHGDSVDGDRAVGAADGLPWQGEDALQHRHALGQIAACVEEARERLGWSDNHELSDV